MTRLRSYRLAVAGVVVLILAAVLAITGEARAEDRPVYPLPTCLTVDQAQCAALLTNRWDGRQVVHQLEPVPACDTRRTTVLVDRLERKNRTLASVRAKVARLRERLAR